jgi:hypothetical protein
MAKPNRKQPKMAIIILETDKDCRGRYIPCIVKEGELGYYQTTWQWGDDKALAQKLADDYNKRLGLTEEQVQELVIQSMV